MYRTRRRKLLLFWAILFFVVVLLVKNRKRRGGRTGDEADIFSMLNSSKLLTIEEDVEKQPAEGRLNVSVWEDICGYELLSLKEFPLFPHAPSTLLTTSSLRIHFREGFENFGLRIFGFLSPAESGNYNFHLASSGSSELWISLDPNPENSKLIANVTSGITSKYERNAIYLSTGKRYYMEILHKHGRHDEEKLNYMRLKWRSSNWKEQELRDIPSEVLTASEDDQNSNVFGKIKFQSLLSQQVVHRNNVLPMHIQHRAPSFVNEEVKRRTEIYHLPFISEEDTRDIFPPCQYNPSYIVKKPLERYQATWETHYTSIYPFDYSDIVAGKMDKDADFVSFGNDQMDENTARKIVSEVWTQLQNKSRR